MNFDKLFPKLINAPRLTVILLCLHAIGCTRGEAVHPLVKFSSLIDKVDSWKLSDYKDMDRIYADSTASERLALTSFLMSRIIAESDFKRARTLFGPIRDPGWISEVPRQDIQTMIDHLNRLAEQQGYSNRFIFRNIDGTEQLGERMSVH